MPSPGFAMAVVWADADLLEVELRAAFDAWSGVGRAYATRGELSTFASALDGVFNGASDAALEIGQRDLGYAGCRVFEYGRNRSLGLELLIGSGEGPLVNPRAGRREIQFAIPIERGQLGGFAASLRALVAAERGEAVLAVPPAWP